MSKEYTAAKKAAIERYLSRYESFVVRMLPDDLARLDKAATDAGKSRAAFVKDAIDKAIKEAGE